MVCCLECCYNVRDENTGGNGHSFGCNAADANRQYAAEVNRQRRRSSGSGSKSFSSSGPQLSPTPGPAPASTPASSVSVMSDGGCASSAAHGLRNGACGHGGSVGAPLASFGNGGGHGGSIGASLATRGDPAPSPITPTPAPAPARVRKIQPRYGVLNADGSRPTCHEDGTTLTWWEMWNQFDVMTAWADGTTMTCGE